QCRGWDITFVHNFKRTPSTSLLNSACMLEMLESHNND
nr:hypothetical protein [Tanacetum cinerariifolium]